MAVHDGERYLAEAVESVLSQTFTDFELLVVDDGSADGTREILARYTDHRIRLLVNERNIGLSASLNRGLREARGELVARQDADDVSEPGRLAAQVDFLERSPETALIGCAYRKIDEHGQIGDERLLPCDPLTLSWHLLFYCPFVHTAATFRRVAVERLGLYDETLRSSMDRELWARLAYRLPVANLPEQFVRYRIWSSSLSATYAGARDELAEVTTRSRRRLVADADEVTAGELDIRVASPELLGVADSPERAELARRAARDILRLQAAFASHYGLSRGERAAHRAEVCYRIAVQLMRTARRVPDPAAARDARRLLRAARALEVIARVRRVTPAQLAALGREARREVAGS
jgi:glycosyltransferase involved in cell wall biosynthesis